MLHLALYHPAIPQNTGNIARTTVGLGAHLHLIHPMKFEITEHAVKRAGLDYWPSVRLTEHADDEAFLAWLEAYQKTRDCQGKAPGGGDGSGSGGGAAGHGHLSARAGGDDAGGGPWLVTKLGAVRYDRAPYADGDVIILGNENTGLPEAWHDRWPGRTVYVPMPGPPPEAGLPNIRSFNVANAAAIVLTQATVTVTPGL